MLSIERGISAHVFVVGCMRLGGNILSDVITAVLSSGEPFGCLPGVDL